MIFHDRADAGRELARQLLKFADHSDVVVLGVPRGGVSVAYEVAAALHAPLDVLLSCKLGVPGHVELAFGAIAAGGGEYMDEAIVRSLGINEEQVQRVTAEAHAELDRRATLYRGELAALPLEGKTVILVDDGIATGASVFAAVETLQQMRLARLVLAAPVAPHATWLWLRTVVDEFVYVELPDPFHAVGSFYNDFAQVDDAEVMELLRRGSGREDSLS